MNAFKEFALRFFSRKDARLAAVLAALCAFAVVDAFASGTVRRTFLFSSLRGSRVVAERRSLPRAAVKRNGATAKEALLEQYVSEALLGPFSANLGRLFHRDAGLSSVMLRGDVAFVSLSEEAAIPEPDSPDVASSLALLEKGLRSNFTFVKEIRFFIGGREPYREFVEEPPAGPSGKAVKKTKSVDK